MNVTDPIADMLTRIRNANSAGKPEVDIPYSRLKAEVANVLKREGYIANFYQDKKEGAWPVLKVQLKMVGKDRSIVGIKRISKPGSRRYVGAKDIPRVLGGMGVSILTTSRGVMTGRDAKRANVGGEILANIW